MTGIAADWLAADSLQAALGALTRAGHRAYVVGGCVRNALLGLGVADVDIATDAHPDRVIDLARAAGLKAVPTGIDHGTVTLVSQGVGYEVTTFRADVETDGRHAVVRFSDRLDEDARRRDFTMNALYADAAGTVVDPLGGMPDLVARRVRFIEDPERRIREDYLRILRYFRFFAWFADAARGHDPEALAAIAGTLAGLEGLSRERVTSELVKLLSAGDPAPAVATMEQVGVLHRLLPGTSSHALTILIHAEAQSGVAPDPLRRLACLGAIDVGRLRLSKAGQKRLALMREGIGSAMGACELGYRHGADTARDILLLRSAVLEQPLHADAISRASDAANQRFPLKAADLMPRYTGPELGAKLAELEAEWIASGFALGRQDLLASL